MFYFEYPTVDTTLYQATPSSSTNTGLDEILEVRKDVNDSGTKIDVSRILIKFSYDYISQSIQDSIIPSTAKYYLNLYDASSQELAVEQTLYTYIVSQSWSGGTGFYSKDPAGEDGASWKYSDNSTTKTQWVSGSDTQELFYNSRNSGMKGFWVFDRHVAQPVSGVSNTPGSFLTVLHKVSQNLSSSSYFGTNASYMEYSSNQHSNDASPSLSTATFLKPIAHDEAHQKSYEGSNTGYIRICLDHYMYGRVSESSNSNRQVVKRPSIYSSLLEDPPDDELDITNSLNSNLGYLDTSDWDNGINPQDYKYSDFSADSSGHGLYRWLNQFSVWFYIKEAAFDSGNTQTVASFYATWFFLNNYKTLVRKYD